MCKFDEVGEVGIAVQYFLQLLFHFLHCGALCFQLLAQAIAGVGYVLQPTLKEVGDLTRLEELRLKGTTV